MDTLKVGNTEGSSHWSSDQWQWDPYGMQPRRTSERAAVKRYAVLKPKPNGPTCQVEGCGEDLSGLKEYHIRYRICEEHLKIDFIIIDGKQQRFCQQCGRFHALSKFDSAKRSCRDRLQRHNARRRKGVEISVSPTVAAAAVQSTGNRGNKAPKTAAAPKSAAAQDSNQKKVRCRYQPA